MIWNPFGTGGIKVKNAVTYPNYIHVEVAAKDNHTNTTITITCDASRKKTTIYSVLVKYGNGRTSDPYFAITFFPDGEYIISPNNANTNITSYSVSAYDAKTGDITIDVTSSTYWNPNYDTIYEQYVVVAYEM